MSDLADLADLADLVRSEFQEPSREPVPISGLWSYRRPILLPPSPTPGESASNELSPPPLPRYRFGLGATKNGDIYFCGGLNHDHPGLLYHYSAKDNTTTVLQCSGDDPGPRYGHAMTMVGNSVLALHGGSICEGEDQESDASLFLFNVVSKKWLRIPTAGRPPGFRRSHSMVAVGTTIFMFGGFVPERSQYFGELWAFDLKTVRTQPRFGGWCRQGAMSDTWSFNTNTKRMDGAVLDDVLYVIGGNNGSAQLNDVFALKISERKWYSVEGAGEVECRDGHAVAGIGTRIFIFGGQPSTLGDKQDMIAVLDAKYINNLELHMPERLVELETDPVLVLGAVIWSGNLMLKRLAELERDKGELIRENSKLEQRLTELEEDNRRAKRQEIALALLQSMSHTNSLASLQGTIAQTMVDFLSEALESRELLQSAGERRRFLHLLRKIVKSAQVFPKHAELCGVECNLFSPVNDTGGYGLIFKGGFEGQMYSHAGMAPLDPDYYTTDTSSDISQQAQAGELALLAHVSHPNVIPLYGAYLSVEHNPRICIVTPWMENGDLVDYLRRLPDTPLIPLMLDVTAGLQFLHEMSVIHADLKARNVLISHSQRAMLADLGVSTIENTIVGKTTAGDFAGTDHWRAPELLLAETSLPPTPTKEADMWGFGCICFEVALTKKIPFNEYHSSAQLILAVLRGQGEITPLRPKLNCDPVFVDGGPLMALAEQCWNKEPSQRPTAAQALECLTALNVQDNRPSMDAELERFEVVKGRRGGVKINYNSLLFIVRKVMLSDAKEREEQNQTNN
ncbi:hypothetical protein AN958_04087 [Leucoagaricus sp. SymC.cos]|nr:hypothetical protein AN958_04087 [Leucoagaricus sp. SymC.cos]